ncbi:MAG: hypothetical protein U9N32_05105 [Spirochaetota bacterium]|nr:hypothetical protein [Spirochaetota bacterium]
MSVDDVGILKKLWKIFWVSSVFPILIFTAVVIVHQLGLEITFPGNIRIWGILLLVFSVTFGVAVPVLFRTTFHGKYIKQSGTDISSYLIYQRNINIVCSISIVFASMAYLIVVSPLYMYGSILAALYGVYSVIPFKEKIEGELKMYKLEHVE